MLHVEIAQFCRLGDGFGGQIDTGYLQSWTKGFSQIEICNKFRLMHCGMESNPWNACEGRKNQEIILSTAVPGRN